MYISPNVFYRGVADQDLITEVVLEPLTWFCHRCFSVAEPPVFIRQETLCGLCAGGVKREES